MILSLIRFFAPRAGVSAVGRFLAVSLLVMLATFSAGIAQADAAIYWGTVRGIARANLDGSNHQPEFLSTGGPSLCALAVNSSHIYWADSYEGTIGRANLDGTGVEDDFIASAGNLPCGLAVDSNYIYWPNMGESTIGRARLDGSGVEVAFIETAAHPCGVAINKKAIYWASDQEKAIWRTDINGINGPEIIIDKATEPCDLALTEAHLFWSDGYANQIGRANLDGSEAIPGFITGSNYPRSLGLYGGHLYWVNVAWGSESIGRANLDGTEVNQRFRTSGNQEYPYGLAVDSVQVTPRPPRIFELSNFRLGKLRRMPSGSVLFPVDLPTDGWLGANAGGAQVSVLPKAIAHPDLFKAGQRWVTAGRRWLRIAPTKKRGSGSRCVLRVFRRGGKIKLALYVTFYVPGKQLTSKNRHFLLFKPTRKGDSRPKQRRRAVGCLASPK